MEITGVLCGVFGKTYPTVKQMSHALLLHHNAIMYVRC